MSSEQKPIWYLPGPAHQYVEDVKALAHEAGLRIIDANVTDDRSNAAEVTPEVTLKPVESVDAGEAEQPRALTTQDLDNARAELERRHDELLAMRADLDARHASLSAQAAEQEAERIRLAEWAAKLAEQADTKPLGIAALREALTARSIAFDADAKKADLQVLLDNSPAQ